MAIQVWDGTKYVGAELGRFGPSGTPKEALVWDGTQYVKVWPVGPAALWSDDFDTSDTTLWDVGSAGGVSPWHSGGETVTSGLRMICTVPVPGDYTVEVTIGTIVGNKVINFSLLDPLNPNVGVPVVVGVDPGLGGIVGMGPYGGFVPLVVGGTVSLVRDGGYVYVRYNGQDIPDIAGSGAPYLRGPLSSNVDAYFLFEDNNGIAVDSIRCIPN